MKRRTFNKNAIKAATFIGITPSISQPLINKAFIRLGGPLFEKFDSPDTWIAALKKQNYRAA